MTLRRGKKDELEKRDRGPHLPRRKAQQYGEALIQGKPEGSLLGSQVY